MLHIHSYIIEFDFLSELMLLFCFLKSLYYIATTVLEILLLAQSLEIKEKLIYTVVSWDLIVLGPSLIAFRLEELTCPKAFWTPFFTKSRNDVASVWWKWMIYSLLLDSWVYFYASALFPFPCIPMKFIFKDLPNFGDEKCYWKIFFKNRPLNSVSMSFKLSCLFQECETWKKQVSLEQTYWMD